MQHHVVSIESINNPTRSVLQLLKIAVKQYEQ
jgi:hypothetical protein